MSLAVLHSRALAGLAAQPVSVEVHLAPGLPSFTIVGLPDTEVKEAKDRVRAALVNCRFEFPARRITVNLAPADVPKESGRSTCRSRSASSPPRVSFPSRRSTGSSSRASSRSPAICATCAARSP